MVTITLDIFNKWTNIFILFKQRVYVYLIKLFQSTLSKTLCFRQIKRLIFKLLLKKKTKIFLINILMIVTNQNVINIVMMIIIHVSY